MSPGGGSNAYRGGGGAGVNGWDSGVADQVMLVQPNSNHYREPASETDSEAGTAFAIVCVLSAAGVLLFCCAKVRPSSYK